MVDTSKWELIFERSNKKVYRDGDRIIKVFKHEKEPKSRVLFEALNQAKIEEETTLNVPKVLEVLQIGEDWAISSEHIEGETLRERMKRDPENLEKYLEKLVDLQLMVHSYNIVGLLKLKDKLHAKISYTGKEQSRVRIEATDRYDLHMRLENMPKHTKLCHGDFQPSNIIVTKDDKYYIIDWAHATSGNSSADVARTYLDFVLRGETKEAELYLKLFCKKGNVALQYVQKWMPIVSATMLNEVKSEEKEKILWRNVNVSEGF